MSRSELAIWVIYPYACLTIFVLGHIWRYRKDQFTWTTRSTQILERDLLMKGVLLFHVGLLMVIGGHVLGLVVPRDLTAKVGVTDDIYHWVSVVMGTFAGLVMTAGFAILVYRRLKVPRVAQNTTNSDKIIYSLLVVMVITGMLATVGINLIQGGYHYRETVSPWFRGIFTLNPDGHLMTDAPLAYQLHAFTAMAVFAFFPFSRLVHAWSVPLAYFGRSPILYRSRTGKFYEPAEGAQRVRSVRFGRRARRSAIPAPAGAGLSLNGHGARLDHVTADTGATANGHRAGSREADSESVHDAQGGTK